MITAAMQIIIIRCSHHHLLKWAPIRVFRLAFEVECDTTVVVSLRLVFESDMMSFF